jgi:DNA-binding GntR family transcriptional regulator
VTTAVDAVAHELRAAILAGAPAPGERLPEEALAARFEVARHTIRAALRMLAAERLVVVSAHRGARVARLEGEGLRALFELRTALEVEAARLLAARGPASGWPDTVRTAALDLERLCATAAEGSSDVHRAPHARPYGDSGRDGDHHDDGAAGGLRAAVDEAHLALHHALVAAAGSPRITQAHAALAAEQRLVLLQSRSTLDPRRMATLHRSLLTDLQRVGPDALRAHLDDGQALSATGGRSTAEQAPQ